MTQTTECALRAKEAARVLAAASAGCKNRALTKAAEAIETDADAILAANDTDMRAAESAGTDKAMLDRLYLDAARIKALADGMREVAAMPDPIGQVIEEWDRPNGLHIRKVRVPIGVIGMIYEARPGVTADSAALTVKSGNAVLLRGSAGAYASNAAIVRSIRGALVREGLPASCVELTPDRSHDSVEEMMRLTGVIDLLIPRGGAGLIDRVVSGSRVPVIQTGVGNCHVYVDDSARPDMVHRLVLNSKLQRPSVCNAAETLLISRGYPHTAELLKTLHEAGVALHGDAAVCALDGQALPACERDYAEEYLSADLCVAMVDGLQGAIDHIARYGTGHTELIITEDGERAAAFARSVDAACVNHNASTRFTDGGQFGFGAEIGIATQKIHARGPLGLRELTIYKYLVSGNGQVRE